MSQWHPDILGEGYEQRVLPLGPDPDGEGEVRATLIRRVGTEDAQRAVLYVHGFTDYFFQTELAEFFTERGYAFYALDLRKCGRSRLPGQTAHYVSDLGLYDDELARAMAIIGQETDNASVVLLAHSTGGLILPLWLDRVRRMPDSPAANAVGLALNSPWFDLQGPPWMRSYFTQALRVISKVAGKTVIRLRAGGTYGASLHISAHGEWDYNVDYKPLEGCPVTFGWLAAIRRGHARLHRGLEVGVPSLVMHSDKTHFSKSWVEKSNSTDVVLDVKQIARWAGCLGGHVSSIPIPGGRHDLFLSQDDARKRAYEVLDTWLQHAVGDGG